MIKITGHNFVGYITVLKTVNNIMLPYIVRDSSVLKTVIKIMVHNIVRLGTVFKDIIYTTVCNITS